MELQCACSPLRMLTSGETLFFTAILWAPCSPPTQLGHMCIKFFVNPLDIHIFVHVAGSYQFSYDQMMQAAPISKPITCICQHLFLDLVLSWSAPACLKFPFIVTTKVELPSCGIPYTIGLSMLIVAYNH